MSNSNHAIKTLHDLLNYEASHFTAGEVSLRNILPKWISMASSFQLKSVLQKYHEQVVLHIQMMEKYVVNEQLSDLAISNKIMNAFIEVAEEKINNCKDLEVKDACLLASIQAINHYKISTYGTAASFANEINLEKFGTHFHEAAINEKQIDDRLTQLADFEINKKAKVHTLLNS